MDVYQDVFFPKMADNYWMCNKKDDLLSALMYEGIHTDRTSTLYLIIYKD